MSTTPQQYTRLTRNAAGLGSYSSLWLAADHLIVVHSTGYNEDYARLHLRDLKALFITGTSRRMWWGIWWGFITGLSLLLLVVALLDGRTPVFSGVFLLLGAAGLLWNHLLGAGCKVHVVTGVQTAVLPSLIRIQQTRRVLAKLQPLIEAAQADLTLPAPTVSAPPAAYPPPPSPV